MFDIHLPKSVSKSQIEYLPIIDNDPNQYSTIYSLLKKNPEDSSQRPVVVTLDYPLWIKAVDIVLQLNLPIVVRLGGFRTLKSFLGSIGNTMDGSGLEELVATIYPNTSDTTASHVLQGTA